MAKTAAALDFGTSKIAFAFGRKDSMGMVTVAGASVAPYSGFRDNAWISESELPEVIRKTHAALQAQVNQKIQEVYVCLPGEYVRVYFREISCVPSGANGEVTQEDLDTLFRQVMDFTRPDSLRLLTRQVVFFLLDSELIRTSPLMMTGQRLTMYVSIVMGDGDFMDRTAELLGSVGLSVAGFVATPTAEAKLISEYMQEGSTSVVLDTGHFTTDIIVMDAGEPIFHSVLELGGARLEQDLAAVLDIPPEAAAEVKLHIALGLEPGDAKQTVETADGQTYEYAMNLAQDVVEARLDDTLRRIQKVVDDFGVTLDESLHIYITGSGFASIRGAREYISQKTGAVARLFQPQTPMTPSPSMTAVVGTLSYVLQEGTRTERPSLPEAIKQFFKEYF